MFPECALNFSYMLHACLDLQKCVVKLGELSEEISATAHFRGKGSLDCDRKSLTVDLKGKKSRRIMPDAAGDKFILLSMCFDDRYSKTGFAYTIMAHYGLFPLNWRYVKLIIDGVQQVVKATNRLSSKPPKSHVDSIGYAEVTLKLALTRQ